jgi:hypothetical protein
MRRAWRTAVFLLLLPLQACRNRTDRRIVSVAVEEGELQKLRPGDWGLGEIKNCRAPEGARQGFMVCGHVASDIWQEAEVLKNGDAREPDSPARYAIWAEHQMEDLDSKMFSAEFKGTGPSWRCKKTVDGLDCE